MASSPEPGDARSASCRPRSSRSSLPGTCSAPARVDLPATSPSCCRPGGLTSCVHDTLELGRRPPRSARRYRTSPTARADRCASGCSRGRLYIADAEEVAGPGRAGARGARPRPADGPARRHRAPGQGPLRRSLLESLLGSIGEATGSAPAALRRLRQPHKHRRPLLRELRAHGARRRDDHHRRRRAGRPARAAADTGAPRRTSRRPCCRTAGGRVARRRRHHARRAVRLAQLCLPQAPTSRSTPSAR